MRIINLKSRNFKGIVAIDITPKDNMIVISGKNGAGKTSALDSIWYTLCWKAGSKGTPMPIRKGEKFAEVTLTLCEDLTKEQIEKGEKPKPLFIVTRKWTPNDNTYLKVTNAEGLIFETPQKLLDGFIGYLSFNPSEFIRMSGKEQKDILIKLTGKDFASMENNIISLREKRRLQGQEVKLLSGAREEITISDLPQEPISISKLQEDYEAGLDHNRGIEDTKNRLKYSQDELSELENKLKEIQEKIIEAKKDIEESKTYLENNHEIDMETIKQKLNQAETINEQIKAKERNKAADQKLKASQEIYDKYTEEIEKNVTDMEKQLKESWGNIPDQKLSLTEDGIAYDGTPYSQIAYSEQLKIAIGIAMALNPKLRVIFIPDYSLLDNGSKKQVREMSDEKGYQVWAESVETGEFGFYIEDGMVKKEIIEHKEEGIADPRD